MSIKISFFLSSIELGVVDRWTDVTSFDFVKGSSSSVGHDDVPATEAETLPDVSTLLRRSLRAFNAI